MPVFFQLVQDISIHAPREGSDKMSWEGWDGADAISIHAPREGSDGVLQ